MRVLKPLLFIAGRCAVGKTLFANEQFKGANVVSVTSTILQRVKPEQLGDEPDPCAVADEFVRKAVADAAKHIGGVVVFDGFPATVDQYRYLAGLVNGTLSEEAGYSVQLFYLRCDADEQRRRIDRVIEGHSLNNDGPRVRWMIARSDREDKYYQDLVDAMMSGSVPLTLVDTGGDPSTAKPVRVVDRGADLVALCEQVAGADLAFYPALAQLSAEERGEWEPCGQRTTWARRFLSAAASEISEAQEFLAPRDDVRQAHGFQSERDHRVAGGLVGQRIVTAIRYLLSASRVADLAPHDIGRMGYQLEKLVSGYPKRKIPSPSSNPPTEGIQGTDSSPTGT